MKRFVTIMSITVIFVSCLFLLSFAADEITITTYYPSPYGSYRELQLYPQSSPTACGSATEGTMYYHSAAKEVRVCNGSSYTTISGGGGFWSAVGTNNIVNTNSGNVGIGDTTPEEKLDIDGRVHISSTTAPSSTTDKLYNLGGTLYWAGNPVGIASGGGPPRVIHTYDPVAGCPPARAANTNLFTQTFTLSRDNVPVYISANLIRYFNGRADLILYVDGVIRDRALTYSPTLQWVDAQVQWVGILNAGNHTVALQSPQANCWGCPGSPATDNGWGSMNSIIFE